MNDRSELLRLVEQAAELSLRDRDAAEELANRVVTRNHQVDDAEVASRAHRVLALVHLRRGDANAAGSHIEQAVEAAGMVDAPGVLGAALLTRVGIRASRGDPGGALADADRAAELLEGHELAQLRIQRATVMATSLGRMEDAIGEYDAMLDDPDLASDLEVIARQNRGLQHLRRGDLERCERDLRRARDLFAEFGNGEAVAEMSLQLAQVAARRGDLPAVFELHESVLESGVLSAGDPRSSMDLCDALLIAGLTREAAALASDAAELAERIDNVPVALEAWLRLGEIHVANGEWRDARAATDRAEALARSAGHDAWRARALLLASRIPDDRRGAHVADSSIIRTLDDAGWVEDAAEARIVLAEAALDRDDRSEATTLLAADDAFGDDGSLRTRTRGAHARALRALATGDSGGARRTLAAALRAIDQGRRRFGAEDLRSAASDRSVALTALGLELAVRSGRPRSILEWSERQRAAALRLAFPQAGIEAEHIAALDEVRRADRESAHDTARLEQRVSRRVRARRAPGGSAARPAKVAEIAMAVGEGALIEYSVVRGDVHAVVVRGGRVRHVATGLTIVEVSGLIGRLKFGLRRLSTARGDIAEASVAVVDAAARALDDALLRPVQPYFGDCAGVVIVPTADLFHLPWAAMPRLRATDLTVAPSAHLWCLTRSRSDLSSAIAADRVVVMAGPDLPDAVGECQEIANLWPGCRWHERAAIDETLDELGSADLAHLAAHGRFRADSPQFSSLMLHDGPLFVHDLDRLDRLPPVMVLSACNLASVEVGRSDDPLGFPAALFARGVQTLIASLLPVSDAASRPLMVELHRRLVTGEGAAAALRAARSSVRQLGPAHRAAADCFMVLGAG